MAPTADTLKPMQSLIRRHPIVAFFVLAHLGSWICWTPMWLSSNGIGLLPFELPLPGLIVVNQVGLFAGPFGAALLVTGLIGGRDAVGRLLRRCLKGRVHPGWWLLAVVAIPAGILAVGLALHPVVDLSVPTVIALTVMAVVYLIGGPLQEEPGWRGFALPHLQQRMPPLTAALVLGVLHCLWHLPLFFTDQWDTARDDPLELVGYLLLVISMSVVMAWLVNGSGGSVLLAILGHNAINWSLAVLGAVAALPVISNWLAAVPLAVLALVGIGVTRGRLGTGRPGPDHRPSTGRPLARRSSIE